VIEDPCYPPLFDLLAASGLIVEPVAVDASGPRPDALEAALQQHPRAVIVTPRAHNPTGAALTPGRAADLRRVLRPHVDLLVIENDPYGPVAGSPAVSLSEGRRNWAIVRSTSKFLGPDLRVALVAGDETTIARLRGRQALGARWVSRLNQRLALALWSDPSAGRLLARAAGIYAQRRAAALSALAAADIAVAAASGFNIWLPVRHEAATVQRLADAGWSVAAGERFRIRSAPGVRVTTSALEPEDARRFAAAFAATQRTGGAVLA
jgi:DNA-binding transcriptional MocR family regulator